MYIEARAMITSLAQEEVRKGEVVLQGAADPTEKAQADGIIIRTKVTRMGQAPTRDRPRRTGSKGVWLNNLG